MGSVADRSMTHVWLALPVMAVGFALLAGLGRGLDALSKQIAGGKERPSALGHLLPLRIPHQAVDVDGFEGHLTGELQGHHDHPGDPEEDDVMPRDQHIRRLEGA